MSDPFGSVPGTDFPLLLKQLEEGSTMDPSNLVVLRGTLSNEPRRRTLPSGTELVQLDLTTPHPDGARSVPLAWFDPPQAALTRLDRGTEVVVVGHVHRRFFQAGGATQSRTEVVVERMARTTRRRDIERLLSVVVERLAGDD